MDDEAPKRGRRRGLRLYLWLAIPLFPAAALIAVNLWLASAWGCAWIAGKIHQRTGLETRIARASVTPWNGIRIDGFEMLQPASLRQAPCDPLLHVKSVKLTPVWKAWFRGRTEIQAIDLDSPHLVLPVELLAHIARGHANRPPPAVAAQPSAAPPVASAETPAPPSPAAPQIPPIPVPANPGVKLPPTGWLRVKDASFRLVSAARQRDFLKVAGVTGEVPVSGDAASSKIRLAELRVADEPTVSNLEARLDWKAPFLTLQPLETTARGLKLLAAGQVALVRGLPLQVEVAAPAQELPQLDLPRESRVKAGNVVSNARFRGLLLSPATWQGECVVQSAAIQARIAGRDAAFDQGQMVAVLSGGALSCRDARLIGDPLSMLGNATLLADGRLAGVLRIVAPPETTESIARHLVPEPSFTPLSTPQRLAFDLHLAGDLRQLAIFQETTATGAR